MEKIKEELLHFDKENPRLVEFSKSEKSDPDALLKLLWTTMDAREIAMSIQSSGLFTHDPLIVAKEDNKYIVIEGNRRLAAIRAIKNKDQLKDISNIPDVSPEIMSQLDEIPVLIQDRKDAWQFLGYKHVNGPAKWGSYAKAKYISQVHRTFKVSLVDIGRQIGDTHNTVKKLYNGLRVIEQAEKNGVFKREDIYKSSFAFSHIYTGMQREGIKGFLQLREFDENIQPVPKDRISELGELLLWLYGSKKDKIEPIIVSQNPDLKHLDQVVRNAEAVIALKSGRPLIESFDITRGSTNLFSESLIKAKHSLMQAKAHLTDGYDNSVELLRVAGSIANLADDLYSEMDRKSEPTKNKRLSESD